MNDTNQKKLVRIDDENHVPSMCSGCKSYCCVENKIVQLFELDIIKLAKRFNMKPAEFKREYCKFNATYGYTLNRKIIDGKDVCVFAKEYLGQKNCSVYSDRPSACFTFPNEPTCNLRELMENKDGKMGRE